MKLLFLGDIVGHPGRTFVYERLPALREAHGLDLVIANAENAAGGAGLNTRIANELKTAGVDAVTLGDHAWDQRGFAEEIANLDFVCRPANLPPGCPGARFVVREVAGKRVAVLTLLGRQFINLKADCPFRAADTLIDELKGQADLLFVEVHAEATSEKVALGWYLDGRAVGVIGTHTHIPTADGRILPRGTAYLTDAGMSGPYNSVLGREVGPVLGRFLDGMPRRFGVAEGDVRLCGAIIEVDPATGVATHFAPLRVDADAPSPA